MTWSMLGWILICLAGLGLFVFHYLIQDRIKYTVRRSPPVEGLSRAWVSAIERGQSRQVVLGDQFWSRGYPLLGLHALSLVKHLIGPETAIDGRQAFYGGDGSLVVFARQIVEDRYQGGFTPALVEPGIGVILAGPDRFGFTAGFLPELSGQRMGILALSGNYGPESSIWSVAAKARGSHVFSAAGTLSVQAALFSYVNDLLIGEEIFSLPGMLDDTARNQATWLTEDILRIVLILFLIIAATLKMLGVI